MTLAPINTLAQLISWVESSSNLLAVRYEPDYHAQPHLIATMKDICDCSYDTAKMLCSTSWGKYQIMGAMLIQLGLTVSPITYCHAGALQDDFFLRYIAADHLSLTLADIQHAPDKRRLFCRLYNGPGDIPGYEARIISVGRAHGLEFTL